MKWSRVRFVSSQLPDRFRGIPVDRAYALALYVLKWFFGKEWIHRHIDEEGGRSGYLRRDYRSLDSEMAHQLRIVVLAEMLFNMQAVEGFECCAKRMLNGEVEDAYAELEIGRLLSVNGATFRFVRLSPTATYDMEVRYPDGLWVCAETKCKLEDTAITPETFRNSLHRARKQLPGDRPGIVFLKTPAHWLGADGSTAAVDVEALVDQFFRGTGRIVSVKLYSSRFTSNLVVFAEIMSRLEKTNPSHRFDADRDWNLFPQHDKSLEEQQRETRGGWNGFPPHWKRLFHLDDDANMSDKLSDKEIARQRDATIKRMLERPPTPHKELLEKRKARRATKTSARKDSE